MNFDLDLDSETVDKANPAEPFCVTPETPLRSVLGEMKSRNRGNVLICEGDKLVGIFTERDALRLMADRADLAVPVEQVMVSNPVTISAQDTVGQAIRTMSQGGYRRLPVIDGNGRPTGVVRVSGILRYLVEHFPNVVYNLPPSPHHTTQEREGA